MVATEGTWTSRLIEKILAVHQERTNIHSSIRVQLVDILCGDNWARKIDVMFGHYH